MGISEPFTVEALDFKLKNDLNKSQESVQGISRWLIKNHEHGDVIVKSWVNELFFEINYILKNKLRNLLSTENNSKKKSLVYLANDLLQNGIKRGAPFRKFFLPHLPGAFASFGICDQVHFISKTKKIQFPATIEIFDECACRLGESNSFHRRICKRLTRCTFCRTKTAIRKLC